MSCPTDLALSARVGSNAAVFADLLRLHVPPGWLIADVTYGEAVWREVPGGIYRVAATDLQTGVDVRISRIRPQGLRDHAAALDLYLRAGAEAHRVLRRGCLLIVKCQDEVSSGRRRAGIRRSLPAAK